MYTVNLNIALTFAKPVSKEIKQEIAQNTLNCLLQNIADLAQTPPEDIQVDLNTENEKQ